MEYMSLLRLLMVALNCAPAAPYTLDNGKQQRPLWILEDQLMKREREDRPEADYMTSTRASPSTSPSSSPSTSTSIQRQRSSPPAAITFLVRNGGSNSGTTASPAQMLPQRRFMLPRRVQLPHSYVQNWSRARSLRQSSPNRAQRRRALNLPIFDNAPGDNALREHNYPIFVYNGTKGELIVNTMLSHQRYPMKEPVPGQVLYPPSTPMFRPKPIVEQFRMPGHREMLNLTLIPFYAHEAMTTELTTETPATSTISTLLATYETQLPRSSKRKMKKVKQYNAYHSPEQVVQWQPSYENQRHFTVTDSLESLVEEEEQEQEQKHDGSKEKQAQQETNNPNLDTSAFQIVYVDESLEPPATTRSSMMMTTPSPVETIEKRQSSRYALKREYFAFPVYTLGKLLQSPAITTTTTHPAKTRETVNSAERESNTWFILNSRYKGPHHLHHRHRYRLSTEGQSSEGAPKYYTSKYIQSVSKPRR